MNRGTMNTGKAIRRAAAVQANIDARPLPRAHTKREKSNGESLREYKPQGYYLYLCYHDKTLYEVCTACRRTKADARRNLSSL